MADPTQTTVVYLTTYLGPPGEPGDAGLSTEQVQDIVAGLLEAGDGMTLQYVDAANSLVVGINNPFDIGDIDVTVKTLRVEETSLFVDRAQFAQDILINTGQNIILSTTAGGGTKFGSSNDQYLSFWGAATIQRPGGWTSNPTGTLTRTTFVSDSATLPQVAARLAALIVDLRATGLIGS